MKSCVIGTLQVCIYYLFYEWSDIIIFCTISATVQDESALNKNSVTVKFIFIFFLSQKTSWEFIIYLQIILKRARKVLIATYYIII